MNRMSGAIIKKKDVRLTEGRRRIAQPRLAAPSHSESAARIVEQGDTGVVIEVTCACGGRTYLHCDYAADPDTT
jgi:hypothetical protein